MFGTGNVLNANYLIYESYRVIIKISNNRRKGVKTRFVRCGFKKDSDNLSNDSPSNSRESSCL